MIPRCSNSKNICLPAKEGLGSMKPLTPRIMFVILLLCLFPAHASYARNIAVNRLVEQSPAAPLFSFSVLSDAHITTWDEEAHKRLRDALADHHALRPNSKLLVMNGDLTNGSEGDYRTLLGLLDKQPHAPVHATMGNHDYYGVWRTRRVVWIHRR
ncbi:metallophosphoesterase [Paenibacillus sp. N3.4]|uniref:metallophosphoesterase family protein n=1 Tax=Paenibacillus sp. N3.4 TaxID=2603222 RepID=UPI0011CBD32F|nr:metallophosphoesterase [Paenibacillus sp. N3.4]TXK82661.1 hypothetical protein FU659_14335 [Paenibacillus sp. N3.4]